MAAYSIYATQLKLALDKTDVLVTDVNGIIVGYAMPAFTSLWRMPGWVSFGMLEFTSIEYSISDQYLQLELILCGTRALPLSVDIVQLNDVSVMTNMLLKNAYSGTISKYLLGAAKWILVICIQHMIIQIIGDFYWSGPKSKPEIDWKSLAVNPAAMRMLENSPPWF